MKKYYLIGIKGAGMSTLASILHDLGNKVIGYDDNKHYKFTEAGLDARGIEIFYDQTAPLTKNTIVIYSGSFKETHREIVRAREMGLKNKPYNEMLGDLSKQFKTISVAGTHGKTTTSLMITEVLENTIGANYFIGDGTGLGKPENDTFVLESCEFRKNFLAYSPTDVLITNLELDHTETYNNIDELIETFNQFLKNINNQVILNGDDENVRKLKTNVKPIYFGLNKNNDIYADNITKKDNKLYFDVYIDNEYFENFEISFFGNYMVLNALAAITVAYLKGVPKELIKKHLSEFRGAKRRFNEYFYNDIVVVDDYAHHPTAIKVTIDAAKMKYPEKEIVAVFLPNTYSRVKDFKADFISSFKKADKVYMMDILSDREQEEDYPGITSDLITNAVLNAESIGVETVNKLMKHHDAVVLFMSCTNISEIEDEYKKLLETR